jgi:hypothetical protein
MMLCLIMKRMKRIQILCKSTRLLNKSLVELYCFDMLHYEAWVCNINKKRFLLSSHNYLDFDAEGNCG